MKNNFTIKVVIIFVFLFLFNHSVFAGTLDVNVDKSSLGQGGIFTATISLNTAGQSINTIKGDLKYDGNYLKAEAVDVGNSFVNFWIEKPNIKTNGYIYFSGMTPGGVSSNQSEVFRVVFRTLNNIGSTNLSLNNVNLYLNDGKGSVISSETKNATIKIDNSKSTDSSTPVVFNDKIPPEKFTITRVRDNSIFDNKWFIDFSAIDKGSGVDHYQVCELLKCITADSPFLLANQTPFYYIQVKAYDLNGNMRSSMIVSIWFVLLVILLILIICGIGVYKKILFLLFLLFFTHTAFAAELNLSPSYGSYSVGDTIKVSVILVSPDQPANVVSDSLTFPTDLLTLTSVSKTNSLVSLWPVDPSLSNADGTLDMGGVILSGYTGSDGTILTLSFKVKAVGNADIESKTSSILAADGQGTNISTGASGASFVLSAAKTQEIKKSTPTPIITDYSQNPREGDFLVVKGSADPLTNIIITSDSSNLSSPNAVVHQSTTIQTDNKGAFTYVSDRVTQGTYIISAQAQDKNGILSDKTSPIKISVVPLSVPNISITTKILNTLSVVVPIIALIVLLILLLIWEGRRK